MFALALLIVALLCVMPAARFVLRAHGDVDRARSLLVFATRGLRADRMDWARAMLVELDHVEGGRERWLFGLGCAWAAVRIRLEAPEPGGSVLRVVVLGCSAVAIALVGYGLVHYPGLRSEPNVWGAIAAFLAILFVYSALAVGLSRGATRRSATARRYGLAGAVAVGAGWLLGIAPPAALKGWVFLPLVIALLGPALVGGIAGRRTHDSGTGTLAALWSGIVGGLTVFIIWVSVTYADAGRPYDSGLVADFHRSGAHDLATYAVSDDLGSGLVLLLMIPTVAFAVGSLSARVGAVKRRT